MICRNNYKGDMENNMGVGKGRKGGRLGAWAGVGGKGRNLYLNN